LLGRHPVLLLEQSPVGLGAARFQCKNKAATSSPTVRAPMQTTVTVNQRSFGLCRSQSRHRKVRGSLPAG
jgi:hypothetical protein